MTARQLVHRHVWQRLPQPWRRALLFRLSTAVAPRPDSDRPRAALPIIVAGVLRSASGLGESARLCHEALRAAGLPVYGIDLSSALMQPHDGPDFAFRDGAALRGAGTLILHVNAPLMPLALARIGARVVRRKRVVGYWAWELPRLPADWAVGFRFVHDVWAPSRFTAAAIAAAIGPTPVHVLPHPLRPPLRAADARPPAESRPFRFLTLFDMASSFARKNPVAVIAAFRRAFADDASVELVVKASRAAAYPEGLRAVRAAIGSAPNIRFVDRVLPAGELEALFGSADALVSLHRSEGFGLTLAEAMLRGLPVIATDWSGSTDVVDSDTGLPIGYRLVPAVDPQGTYNHPTMTWAEADIPAAAAAMTRLRTDPTLRHHLGTAGRQGAEALTSPSRYAGEVRRLLGVDELVSG